MGRVSGAGELTEASCLGAVDIDAETGAEIGAKVLCPSVLKTAVAGAQSTLTTGATLSGKVLGSMDVKE